MVCQEAIGLFGHVPVITSQACFHMSDWDIQFALRRSGEG